MTGGDAYKQKLLTDDALDVAIAVAENSSNPSLLGSEPKIIYEDEHIRVIWKSERSKQVVITFGDLVGLADGLRFFADNPLRKLGITSLGIMAKKPNWFPQKSMRTAIGSIRELIDSFAIRLIYGGSMGGYAAIKYSRLLGASHVIALCPQWSIDRNDCPDFDTGWGEFFTEDLRDMAIRSNDVQGKVYIFVDPFEKRDMSHYKMIYSVYPTVNLIKTPMIGHHVTSVFAGTDNLEKLLISCQDEKIADLKSFSRKTRKDHPVRIETNRQEMKNRLPRIAVAYIISQKNNHLLLHDISNWAYVINYYAERGNINSAVTLFNNSEHQPRSIMSRQLICAYLAHVANGRVAAATTHNSWLIYDAVDNKVIHKQPPFSSRDFIVELKYGRGKIMMTINIAGSAFPLSVAENGHISVLSSSSEIDHSCEFEIEDVGESKFCLKYNDMFLSATLYGNVICNRTAVQAWEMFKLGILKH